MVNRTLSFRKRPPVQRSMSSDRPLGPIPVVAQSLSTRRALLRSGSSFESLDGGQSVSSIEPEQVRKGQRRGTGGRGPPVGNSSVQLSFRTSALIGGAGGDNSSLHGSSHHSFRLHDSFSKLNDSFYAPNLNNSSPTSKVSSSTSNPRLVFSLASLLIAGLCSMSLYVQTSMMYRHVRVDEQGGETKQKVLNNTPSSHSTLDGFGPEMTGFLKNDVRHAPPVFEFASNNLQLEQYAADYGLESIGQPITAYIEPPLNDTVPGTGSRHHPDDPNYGTPPEFRLPLPLRTHSPRALRKIVYPHARTCQDIPHKLPIDRGLQIDPETGLAVAWNTGNSAKPIDYAEEEAKSCPVELDPFLPWYVL
jgi:hypothetical protein